MMTLQKLKAAHRNAERREGYWFDEYDNALHTFCIPLMNGHMFNLYLACKADYDHGRSVADAVEAGKFTVYEEEYPEDGVFKVCTRHAIARLRLIERKLKEWQDKYYYLDCALDECWDESKGISALSDETKRDLAAVGITV